jgi:ATP-dependent Lon protease
VQEELGEKQREMVLREQLKAIQKELGEGDEGSEIEELEERIAALDVPPETRSEIDRELGRLRRTNPQSAEYQVVRTFLELVVELPWNDRTEDKIDLHEAERILEEDHYGLEDVKDRILEFLAVRKLQMERAAREAHHEEADASVSVDEAKPVHTVANGNGEDGESVGVLDEALGGEGAASDNSGEVVAKARAVGRGPILLFVGPPGVGKTSIAKSIARALSR